MDNGKRSVLIMEDSRLFTSILVTHLENVDEFEFICCETIKEAEELSKKTEFVAALVDLHLPDSPNGEAIDFTINAGIPTIAMTSNKSKRLKELAWSKKLVDYIIKKDTRSLSYISVMLRQLVKNKYVDILVVDDGVGINNYITELLETHKFNVFQAFSAEEALKIVDLYPHIKLVIADYNMGKVSGVELTSTLRESFTMNDIAILGISSVDNPDVTVEFIRSGANDFLSKPFVPAMLYCRVYNIIKTLDMFRKLKDSTLRDPLTGLYNRRYLFETGGRLIEESRKGFSKLCFAMIDIDFFKNVNDTHGHIVGDYILIEISKLFEKIVGEHGHVSRFGGEEFCIILPNSDDPKDVIAEVERLRRAVEEYPFVFEGNPITVSVSIGLCLTRCDSVDDAIKIADDNLYIAKKNGRNQVCSESTLSDNDMEISLD